MERLLGYDALENLESFSSTARLILGCPGQIFASADQNRGWI